MNKTNYPSLTNYLAKTKKNADLYRLYNPQFTLEQTFVGTMSACLNS